MGRSFNGSTDYGEQSGAAITTTLGTMAAWCKNSTSGNMNAQVILDQRQNNNHQIYLCIVNTRVRMYSTTNVGSSFAEATVNHSTTDWFHAAGVLASASSRSAYYNGSNKGSETTSRTPNASTDMNFGYYTIGAGQRFYTGSIAVPCIWNVALSDDEIAALAAGVYPTQIRPANIVAFWPLTQSSGAADIATRYNWSFINTAVVEDKGWSKGLQIWQS